MIEPAIRNILAATFAIAAAMLAPFGDAKAVQAAASASADRLEGMDCSPFRWAAVGDHERGAIVIDANIDGQIRTLQLDTGAEYSLLGGAPDGGLTATSVKLGQTQLGPLWFAGEAGGSGTLGLDGLIGLVVAIDYPRTRICLARPAHFPFSIFSATKWAPAEIRNGHLFVPLKIGNREYKNFFFDTGASLFPISTDAARWSELTGLADANQATDSIKGKAWGEPIELFGAKTGQLLQIGDVRLGEPMVYFEPARPNFFRDSQENADGLIGNASVWDRTVVLYLSSRPRFGLLDPS